MEISSIFIKNRGFLKSVPPKNVCAELKSEIFDDPGISGNLKINDSKE
jgi:hypothetical protein